MLALLAALLIGGVVAFLLLRGSKAKPARPVSPGPSPSPQAAGAATKRAAKVDITAKSASARKASDAAGGAGSSSGGSDSSADHPLVLRHLRGHQGDITGVAMGHDGRHIASVAKDEQLRLWTVVDSEKNTHFARHNLKKGEFASAVALSSDSKYCLIAIAGTRQVQIFGIRDDGKTNQSFLQPLHTFPTPHKSDISCIRMSANAAFVVTLAEGAVDLNVHVWSVKGALIQTLSVAQLVNHSLAVSDDSRFIAVASKIADCKIFEVMYRKDAKGASGSGSASASAAPAVEKVELAFTLKGMKRGAKRLAFAAPASRALLVSASVDGSFYVHSLRARYAAHASVAQDPVLLTRTQTDFASGLDLVDVAPLAVTESASKALDEQPALVAVAAGPALQFWRSATPAQPPALIASVTHPHKGAITALEFSKRGSRTLLLTAGENKSITLWKLPQ